MSFQGNYPTPKLEISTCASAALEFCTSAWGNLEPALEKSTSASRIFKRH